MKTKRLLIAIIVVSIFSSILFSINAFAGEDNFPYSFTMKANQASSYSSDSYERTTIYYDNPWKVNMTFNGEGTGTIATYWIASKIIHTAYSAKHNVTQGSGDHYYFAYSNASGEYVRLGVQNNNNTTNSYTVSGYWDEEIGHQISNEG